MKYGLGMRGREGSKCGENPVGNACPMPYWYLSTGKRSFELWQQLKGAPIGTRCQEVRGTTNVWKGLPAMAAEPLTLGSFTKQLVGILRFWPVKNGNQPSGAKWGCKELSQRDGKRWHRELE